MEPQEAADSEFQPLDKVSLADLARDHTAAATPPSSSSGGAHSGLEMLEEQLRVVGESWILGDGGGVAAGAAAPAVKSARALALASRTSRQHLFLMKRITLCVPRTPCVRRLLLGASQVTRGLVWPLVSVKQQQRHRLTLATTPLCATGSTRSSISSSWAASSWLALSTTTG
jgi:hypothetical protein